MFFLFCRDNENEILGQNAGDVKMSLSSNPMVLQGFGFLVMKLVLC